MQSDRRKARLHYTVSFLILLIIESCIALFVRDTIIRPYIGDLLVTVLICCFVRIWVPKQCKLLPVWVFLFSVAVEIAQYFDFISLLGLGNHRFFRILLGSTFSLLDLICYAAGCILFFLCEKAFLKISSRHSQ